MYKSSIPASELLDVVLDGSRGRPGPVFLELPDVQAAQVPDSWSKYSTSSIPDVQKVDCQIVDKVASKMISSERPVLLLGGGLSYKSLSTFVKNWQH